MNVLVTGGAGYLGAVLAGQLLAEGHRVRVLDSLLHGGEALLGLYSWNGFEFRRGDIRSAEDVNAALEDMDAVVHLAAIVGDPASKREEPGLVREVNVEASLGLHECSRGHVKRFLFASTCSNYGRMGNSDEDVDESSPLRPISLYAESKVEVELELLDRVGNGPVTTILRLATLFGLAPRMRFDLTVNEFAAELARGRPLEVYGEQFWRPYLHVADAARAIRAALAAPEESVAGEVFNAGDTAENYTKADIVALLRERLGQDIVVEHVEVLEDPRDYRVSFAKIERVLGFRASRSVGDGIDEIIDAVRNGLVGDPTEQRYRN